MSGSAGHRKRLVCVNSANIRESHLFLTGHTDLFPADCFSPSTAGTGTAKELRLHAAGIPEPVYTGIPIEARAAKPHLCFRKRARARAFLAKCSSSRWATL